MENPWENNWKCKNCGFDIEALFDDTYIKSKKDGRIISVRHPGECFSIWAAFDSSEDYRKTPLEETKKMGGVMTSHICMDCLQKFQIDIGREPDVRTGAFINKNSNPTKLEDRICPNCSSKNIKNFDELLVKRYGLCDTEHILFCPKCKTEGISVYIPTFFCC